MMEHYTDQHLDGIDEELMWQAAEELEKDLLAAVSRHAGVSVQDVSRNSVGTFFVTLRKELDDGSYLGQTSVTGHDLAGIYTDLIWYFNSHEEVNIMNLYGTNLFKYITGEMVKDKAVTMTVKNVSMEKLQASGRTEEKPVVFFQERDKGAVLNKTNAKALIAEYGPETNDWAGKTVTLYAEKGTWFGKTGYALRMRPGNGGNSNGTQAPPPPDDVPAEVDQTPLFDEPAEVGGTYAEE